MRQFIGPFDNAPGYPRLKQFVMTDPMTGQQQQYTEDFFVYNVNPGAFAINATVISTLNIQADSDFEWLMTTYSAQQGTAVFANTAVVPITVQIQDSGSSRNLLFTPTPITSLAGLGSLPFYLPVPRVFLAKSTITFTFLSLDGTNAWSNVFLNLIGRKIFRLGG